ncbi:DegT/DnrJ/EryC1/StrS family aminotransferase [Oleiagrimonas sp. MCCC 1A03011]|uniref:DegT/DnrJ/EryC1/StrS family aminotransferase n=1 Tax=Oleiagrimonas sp. MCCC 1A03011 TaxID=1926883 RepID=UPI000DC2B65C|nr:DegT/DnrJ/EryC1/StrS family aminotransferase [Oleiagrimonas sp. MCCC 1A03011]RAP59379.1 dTDP-4-dehydro-6-deoxyglucose aminotransferase [Oleiagrimonas sp. MCCC 1A03011]
MSIKRVHSAKDLAINGAPPAFDQPLHVGRPNIGDHENFLAMTRKILGDCWLTNNGPLVRQLEGRIADMLGVGHCVAMCNGTVALEIAIRALGLKGEVIVPSWTFIATAHALHWQGITPVFADIDPTTHNLDPDAVRRMITPRTSGIIGVHLWGRPAPATSLQALADEYGLQLMFDAAHAFGCSYQDRSIGNFGACEVFSFHATKVFNTFEGGAVVTNDGKLAEKMRLMRNFGFAGYDDVIHPGTNGKMPEINAAMGLVNLANFPAFVEANRRAYTTYAEALSGINGITVLSHDPANEPNYHYVVAEVDDDFACSRDVLVAALQAENVLARKYFWPGCHNMKPYHDLFPNAGLALPSTEAVAQRVIVLPNGMNLPEGSIKLITDVFRTMSRMS